MKLITKTITTTYKGYLNSDGHINWIPSLEKNKSVSEIESIIYDKDGFDKFGYDAHGYDRDGYNIKGLDGEGYNKQGFDEEGYDRDGYDKYGYDRHGKK